MPSAPVFISHASSDDAFVRELRHALESFNIPVWVDSSNLRSGNALTPAIAEAIAQARHVLVVLSPQIVNSVWVRREVRQALAVQQQRQAEGYRVIPLLLPGVETTALALWFEEELLAVPIALTVTGLSAALPAILAALGEPGSVAAAWHQIGMVHKETGQFAQAEHAYRQSLALRVQQQDRAGEVDTLGELGDLYDAIGRLEDAVTFYRQAAERYASLGNLRGEGSTLSDLANTLLQL